MKTDGSLKPPHQRQRPHNPSPAQDLSHTIETLEREIGERRRAEAELQRLNAELEDRVQKRTLQLEELNRKLAQDLQERLRVQAVIQKSEERYRRLTESSPDAIFITNQQGALLFVNQTCATMAGLPPDQLVGKQQEDIFPPEIAQAHRHNIEQVFNRHRPPTLEECITLGGRQHWIDTRLVPLEDEHGRIVEVLGISRVITVRKEMEKALRENEARHHALLKAIPDLMFLNDRTGIFIDYQAKAPENLLVPPDGFLGRTLHEVLPSHIAEALQAAIHRALDSQEIQVQEYALNVRGQSLYFEARIVACDHNRVCTIVRDISERRRLEEEILEISQRERRRLGQDFHDSLGQNLVGLTYLSKALRQKLESRGVPEAAADAREIENLAHQITHQARRLARGLSPLEPTAEGLMHALQEMADHTAKIFNLPCHFQCNPPVLVHSDFTAIHLYYIAQEAVNNAVKHGHPSRITIALDLDPHHLTLTVSNDGLGLNPATPSPPGLGLRTMAHRARSLGGTLEFSNQPAGGTRVRCVVPLPNLANPTPAAPSSRRENQIQPRPHFPRG
jgi:PAS domain S-box-containing protein